MKTQREEKLEKQLAACKEALSSSRKALHRERQKIRDLIESHSRHKSKKALLSGKLKEAEAIKKKRSAGGASEQYIDRHKYTDFTVALCVDPYVSCRSSIKIGTFHRILSNHCLEVTRLKNHPMQ